MTSALEAFMRWWNWLSPKNGKLKFRNGREAAEFVRRIQNENGGPNAKIQAMRERYNQINRSRDSQSPSRFDQGPDTAVL